MLGFGINGGTASMLVTMLLLFSSFGWFSIFGIGCWLRVFVGRGSETCDVEDDCP